MTVPDVISDTKGDIYDALRGINEGGIVLVGPCQTLLSTVAHHLVVTSDDNSSLDYIYHIDNKYYTADIPVRLCSDLPAVERQACCPAVVFVFDRLNLSFFEEIVGWWERYDGRHEIDIPLLMAWDVDQEEDAAFMSRALEWCADHGFELIEPLTDADNGAQNRETGVPRLQDALQAYMWPHAVMKGAREVAVPHSVDTLHPDIDTGDIEEDEQDDQDDKVASCLLGMYIMYDTSFDDTFITRRITIIYRVHAINGWYRHQQGRKVETS